MQFYIGTKCGMSIFVLSAFLFINSTIDLFSTLKLFFIICIDKQEIFSISDKSSIMAKKYKIDILESVKSFLFNVSKFNSNYQRIWVI